MHSLNPLQISLMVLIIKISEKLKLLPSAGTTASGIRPISYQLLASQFIFFDDSYYLQYVMLSTRAAFDDASVPNNAITQSPDFDLASGIQLLNNYSPNQPPTGNRPVVAYDTVSVILSSQTISHGSEPLVAKKFYRLNYELKSNFIIAFGAGEVGLQQVQVVAVARVTQDNVL
ncbi:MAG: hypothetical protein EZS28_030138 [Streblomastix strix]|uniref:Uncharacterized protein n=1 Tax=Streblomastix strix TaxID=222440 RepID=A0A5J4UX43_9EUKA|nr:MAG: hypothetical protein EZS28_030138 [Streblomastix strix]